MKILSGTDITNLNVNNTIPDVDIFDPQVTSDEWPVILNTLEGGLTAPIEMKPWFAEQVLAIYLVNPQKLEMFMHEGELEATLLQDLKRTKDLHAKITIAAVLKVVCGLDAQYLINTFAIDLQGSNLRYLFWNEQLRTLIYSKLLKPDLEVSLPKGSDLASIYRTVDIDVLLNIVAALKLLFPEIFQELNLDKLGLADSLQTLQDIRQHGNRDMLAFNIARLKIIHSSHSAITHEGIVFDIAQSETIASLPNELVY